MRIDSGSTRRGAVGAGILTGSGVARIASGTDSSGVGSDVWRLPVCGVGSELEGAGGTVPVRQLATRPNSKTIRVTECQSADFIVASENLGSSSAAARNGDRPMGSVASTDSLTQVRRKCQDHDFAQKSLSVV